MVSPIFTNQHLSLPPPESSFEQGLTAWLNDPEATGNKPEAVLRIRRAFYKLETTLDLKLLKLSCVPKEIGQLQSLRELFLGQNNLLSLPNEIGQLKNLNTLSLSYNRFSSIPKEIGELENLNTLYLHSNKLTSLPSEIGQLSKLEWLELDSNSHLNDLPMSLGNPPMLIHISRSETGIPYEIRRAILEQCRNHRDACALVALPEKLATWKVIGKNTLDLSKIQEFTESEKITLNEWLMRLERTSDFSRCQSSLANIVCDILASVIINDEFRALFINQAEANNSHCEDRAAMSLNEIYLAWKIHFLSEETPLKKKLALMTGCAKTLTLRNEIGKIYAGYRESVEVYLYCEHKLKTRLGLVTAIQTMTYPDFAKRNSINPEQLITAVNSNFFGELYKLPIFQKNLQQDPDMAQKLQAIEDRFQKALEVQKSQKDAVISARSNQLMSELEEEKKQAALEWYNKKI